MAATIAAPAAYGQPSRKGKKAWRKNVDIEPVTSGLDAAREEYRQTGGQLIKDLSEDQLFQTDTSGNEAIRQRTERRHGKLKVDEILAVRSNIPALDGRNVRALADSQDLKRKRGSGLPTKDRARLWRLANSGGHTSNHSATDAIDPTYDPWAVPESTQVGPDQSFLPSAPPPHEPKTLREKPIPMTATGKAVASVPKPHAGRSYNPQSDLYFRLLQESQSKEVALEKLKLREEAEDQEKQERAKIAAAEADREEHDKAVMSEYESEWEGFQSEPDEAMLSARRPERKTPAERNKIKRRKAAEVLERHNDKMRLRERGERQAGEILRMADQQHRQKLYDEIFEGFSSDEDADGLEGQENEDLAKRPRLGTRFGAPRKDLELVLPEELKESLRELKPEGNLLKDRYRTVILQGRTESRTPLPMQKKPRRKATEKWSYKDWALEKA